MNALLNCDECGREGCESPGGPCYDCDADKRAGRPIPKKPLTMAELHKIVHERAAYIEVLQAQCRRAEEILERICRGDYPQILQSCWDVLNRREYIRLDEPVQPPMAYDEIVAAAPAHWRYLPHHPCRDCGHKPDEPGGDFCIPDGKEHIRLETTIQPEALPTPSTYDKTIRAMESSGYKPEPVEWIANDRLLQCQDLIDHVAKELVDADMDQFGRCWPWPVGDSDKDILAREEAREVALVAIRAFLSWGGHQRKIS